MAMCASLYAENVLPPKELELLLVAFDAAYVHIYGPGTRRHIKNAFKAGATVEEIMEVLKLGVVQGVQACNLGVTLLAEELERDGRHKQRKESGFSSFETRYRRISSCTEESRRGSARPATFLRLSDREFRQRTSRPNPNKFFHEFVGLNDGQIREIREGKAIAKILDSPTADQVFVFGSVYINSTPERYLKFASDIDALRKLPSYIATSKVQRSAAAFGPYRFHDG